METKLKIKGKYKITVKRGNEHSTIYIENIITDDGLDAISAILGEGTDNSLMQYFVLGTDNTVPAITDTQLVNETYRKSPENIVVAGNVITVSTDIEFDEGNGFTFREIGIVGIDGVGALNTGTLISRALISPEIPKTSSVVINIEWQLTITRV